MIRSLTAVALSFSLAATPALAQTVVIVRHGEKVSPNGDPDLSPTGQARAQALAASLAGAKVSMVLATPLKRTQQTGQPAADMAMKPPGGTCSCEPDQADVRSPGKYSL